MPEPRFFASDNAAGVHPVVFDAIQAANEGHALAYGHDPWTDRAAHRIGQTLGGDPLVLFLFGGTGANVVGLRSAADSVQSVLCAESAHLWRDECAAPEHFLGGKLVPIATSDGKLRPDDVTARLVTAGDVHRVPPGVVSISQATEWGTVYTVAEIRALADAAHTHGMRLHVDGARLANAAAGLDLPLQALGADAGVDVLTLGGTKLGLLFGDAVVIFDETLRTRARYYQMQAMQLVSKMRFVAAQFEAVLTGTLWRDIAGHANEMARRLGDGLRAIDGITLVHPVQANMVFVRFPTSLASRIQQDAGPFHRPTADPAVGRLVTAWDTHPSDIEVFVDTVASIVRSAR